MSPPTRKPQKSNQAPSSSLWDVPCLVMSEPVKVENYKPTLGRRKPSVNVSHGGVATQLVSKESTFLDLFGLPLQVATVSVGCHELPAATP
jgi:hypothetical protein